MTHLRLPGNKRALAVLSGAIALALVPPPAGRRAAPRLLTRHALAAQGPLLAGAASAPLPAPPGGSLGGYGPLRGGAVGLREPPLARAVALGELDLVELDVVETPEPLVDEIRRLRPRETVIAFASHTHEGPAGFDDRLLAEALGMGRFRPTARLGIADAASRAIAKARASMVPAQLRLARASLPGLQDERHEGGAPDPGLWVLAVDRVGGRVGGDAGDGAIATIVGYGAHPTLLPARERRYSPDWPGAAERAVETARGGVALVAQGAGGDAAAHQADLPSEPDERLRAYGSEVAQAAMAALAGSRPLDGTLGFAEAEVALPPLDLEPFLRWPHGLADRLVGPLGPRTARVAALALGGATLLCVPGELTGAARRQWSEANGQLAAAAILSLCGGDVSYVESERLYRAHEGEPLTLFGPALAARLGEAAQLAAGAASELRP